jgi:uncharacterized BrkB/YihY/UPF0761 family membrane protein
MAQVWNVPGAARPNFVARLVRSVMFLALLAAGLIVTTGLSGFGTFGRHDSALGYLAEGLAGALNIVLYFGSFWVLTPKVVSRRTLWPGAVFGGVVWTVLQALGGYVVDMWLAMT